MASRFFLIVVGLIVVLTSKDSGAQGFLHRDEKNIVDGQGEVFIIRSIGTGNWMLQEGYMMKTAGVAGTQHEFREKLIEEIGIELTDSFYNVWLENHFTRTDVDSMKAWGFNAVRPALHYKWFTLPIEDEPDETTNTWLNKGFEMVDSLVAWCADNEMYVILDMHGAPGGQGYNADISDYDPDKPSLWESEQNKQKLIALWRKLAERYADEQWIGGYDLINETNWTFDEPNNQPLWNLLEDITVAIREVDDNHLVFTEGNWFANDYSGFPGLWDDNMAISFHKYWTYNDEHSLDWMINIQDQHNAPLWLGESGENSNTWFTNLIALAESKNIGWSWWPVKKSGINNVLQVITNTDYDNMVKGWRGEIAELSAEATFQAVMAFAENHKIENCIVQRDVIDAMIRQPNTTETQAFKNHVLGEKIYFSDYDLGRNNYAYYDKDTANYSGNTGQFGNWNTGWGYRNDGVDIESCGDNFASNGYSVGWTQDGEWMQYTINTDSAAAYTLQVRSASDNVDGSYISFEVDGTAISPNVILPDTDGWQTWSTTTVEDVILPAGELKIRAKIEKAGSNLNYFEFINPKPVSEVPFKFLSGNTTESHKRIQVSLNKELTDVSLGDLVNELELTVDNIALEISKVELRENNQGIEIFTYKDLLFDNEIHLSYSGSSIQVDGQTLTQFADELILNSLPIHIDIPSKIEAEAFHLNSGFELEDCEDFGEGQNLGYADPGDYVEYTVYVENAGTYKLDYRVASENGGGQLTSYMGVSNNLIPIHSLEIESTGGWQSWKTQSFEVSLNAGVQTLKLLVNQGGFNLNWIKFTFLTSSVMNETKDEVLIYPNPAQTFVNIDFESSNQLAKRIEVIDIKGDTIQIESIKESSFKLQIEDYPEGVYFLRITEGNEIYTKKILKK